MLRSLGAGFRLETAQRMSFDPLRPYGPHGPDIYELHAVAQLEAQRAAKAQRAAEAEAPRAEEPDEQLLLLAP